MLGQWEIGHRVGNQVTPNIVPPIATTRDAFSQAEAWVRQHRAQVLAIMNSMARWRNDPATASQLATLKKLQVPGDHTKLTKGEASDLIGVVIARRGIKFQNGCELIQRLHDLPVAPTPVVGAYWRMPYWLILLRSVL